MTRNSDLKTRARQRMARTGERYTIARMRVLADDVQRRADEPPPPLTVTDEEWGNDEPCRLLWQNLTVQEHSPSALSIRFRGRICPRCHQPTLFGYWKERDADFEARIKCRTIVEHGSESTSCGYDVAIENRPRPRKGNWPRRVRITDEVRQLLDEGSSREPAVLSPVPSRDKTRVSNKQEVDISNETCPACAVGRLTAIRFRYTTVRDFYVVPADVPIEFEAAAALCRDCHALFSTDFNQRHSMLSHSLPRGSGDAAG